MIQIFDYLKEQEQVAIVCPQVPWPDYTVVPEYLEELIPAKIRFDGTSAEWHDIIKLKGEKKIPSTVTTNDEILETYL